MNKKVRSFIDEKIPSLAGKSFLVTGATSGIGLELTKWLFYKGAHVSLFVRNKEKAESLVELLEVELGKNLTYDIHVYDQDKRDSIIRAASEVRNVAYDGIYLGAGIYYPKKGLLSDYGNPMTIEVDLIGVYLLFEELSKYHPHSKYVFMDSIAAKKPKKGDYARFFHQKSQNRRDEYGAAKMGIRAIFSNLHSRGFDVYLTHPGITKTSIFGKDTPLAKRILSSITNLFVHPVEMAILPMLSSLSGLYEPGSVIVPKGLFEISGFPKKKKGGLYESPELIRLLDEELA